MQQFIFILSIQSATLFLLNTLYRFLKKEKKSVDIISGFLFLAAFILVFYSAWYPDLISRPWLYNLVWGIRYFAYISIPPLFFLLVYYFLAEKQLPPPLSSFLFIPSILFFIAFIVLTITNRFFFNLVIFDNTPDFRLLYLFSIADYLLIFILILMFIILHRPGKKWMKRYIAVIILFCLLIMTALLDYFNLKGLSILFLSLILLIHNFVMIRFPDLFKEYQVAVQKERSNHYLKNLDLIMLERHLREVVVIKRGFADSSLKMIDVATQLKISSHQLSELLNVKYQQSFNHYINHFRIIEARRMMGESPDSKILDICYDCGFNTPSAFYRAFKSETGMTPTNYIRSLL